MNEEEYKQHLLAVMERYAEGMASETDMKELDKWYESFPDIRKYADGMNLSEKRQAQDRILHNINKQIYQEATPSLTSYKKPLYRRVAWVAMVISVLCAGLFYYIREKGVPTTNQLAEEPIVPGAQKAFLILSDGHRISLTDAANGKIAEQAGMRIDKTAGGQLIYEIQNSDQGSVADLYNTLETPKGGQYQVRLPDGTFVWLNAASSLKYPASFSAHRERRVELSGEAYFEVTKDRAKPFIVVTNSRFSQGRSTDKEVQEINVLGTHFNVQAYHDEQSIKTTLLEGSVQIRTNDGASQILKPGQQLVNNGHDLKVVQVNAEYAVAWKDGYFRFNDKTLEMGMNEIARWYNVSIHYQNPALKREPLAGTISKYSSIGQVLRKMELTGAFHFSIRGKEIIVE